MHERRISVCDTKYSGKGSSSVESSSFICAVIGSSGGTEWDSLKTTFVNGRHFFPGMRRPHQHCVEAES